MTRKSVRERVYGTRSEMPEKLAEKNRPKHSAEIRLESLGEYLLGIGHENLTESVDDIVAFLADDSPSDYMTYGDYDRMRATFDYDDA